MVNLKLETKITQLSEINNSYRPQLLTYRDPAGKGDNSIAWVEEQAKLYQVLEVVRQLVLLGLV